MYFVPKDVKNSSRRISEVTNNWERKLSSLISPFPNGKRHTL